MLKNSVEDLFDDDFANCLTQHHQPIRMRRELWYGPESNACPFNIKQTRNSICFCSDTRAAILCQRKDQSAAVMRRPERHRLFVTDRNRRVDKTLVALTCGNECRVRYQPIIDERVIMQRRKIMLQQIMVCKYKTSGRQPVNGLRLESSGFEVFDFFRAHLCKCALAHDCHEIGRASWR